MPATMSGAVFSIFWSACVLADVFELGRDARIVLELHADRVLLRRRHVAAEQVVVVQR